MTDDDKTRNLAEFSSYIEEPQFRTAKERKHFVDLLQGVYRQLDQMTRMAFMNRNLDDDSFIPLRNKILDAMQMQALLELEFPHTKEEKKDSQPNTGKFEQTLAKWNGDSE